ncbi:MAG: signal peptidase I [Ruminococcus sp.]|nr:signal peptidase I [Ruminococcus sp.]
MKTNSEREKEETRGSPPDESSLPKPASTKRLAISLLIKIAAIALAVWLVFTFVLGITINYGNNMHPAVNDGDLVITLKLQRPYLNAAVLYRHDGKMRAGRVVGLPGNIIDISEKGELYVNNAIASEDIFYPTYKAEGSAVSFPYTVEEGKAFILNDYREDTDDSRIFGAVDMKDIDGPFLFTLRRRGF